MVSVDGPGMDDNLMRPRRLAQQFSASLPNVSSQHRIAVLRHPDHMVLAVPNRVAAALVRFHPANLYRKRRDPMPPKGVGFSDPLSGTLNGACRSFLSAAVAVFQRFERR